MFEARNHTTGEIAVLDKEALAPFILEQDFSGQVVEVTNLDNLMSFWIIRNQVTITLPVDFQRWSELGGV